VETISAIDATTVTVDSIGGSGDCIGDSGSPLLIRDDAGITSSLGLLWKGSQSCDGHDVYLRLDALTDWLGSTVGDLSKGTTACGGLATSGRCFSGVAVWCDNGNQLAASRCTPPTTCGWSSEAQGYRCVANDPCGGAPELGSCDGSGSLRVCNQGQAATISCDPCGATTCKVSSADARAQCEPSISGGM